MVFSFSFHNPQASEKSALCIIGERKLKPAKEWTYKRTTTETEKGTSLLFTSAPWQPSTPKWQGDENRELFSPQPLSSLVF